MSLFSIAWCRSKYEDISEAFDASPTYLFYGDRESVYVLAFDLKNLGFPHVTVRDALGNVVDVSGNILDISIHHANCFISHPKGDQNEQD